MTTDHPANSFSQAKSDDFANRLLTMLNQSSLGLMISIGHRTGLFDAMGNMPPSTSGEIATQAALNERYVREWLGAMVTGRVVEVDPATLRYRLPAEHAAFLTRPAGANNIAVFAQYIGLLGAVEDDIVNCFRKGGGVPYARFERFHEVMAEDSGQSVLSSIESHILPLVPGLVDRLTSGINMLDVGCGRGLILQRFAALFPNSSFTGMDLSEEAIVWARQQSSSAGLRNIEFRSADLSEFDQWAPPESFDFITTFDAIHDQARPLNVLKGIHRALKPGRRLPDAGHQRLQPTSQEHRPPDRSVSIHSVHACTA